MPGGVSAAGRGGEATHGSRARSSPPRRPPDGGRVTIFEFSSRSTEMSDNVSGAGDGAVVELRVPARAALIPTVRAVTADLAARAGFAFDAVDDLRMAVDEASSAAVSSAGEDGLLYCRFVTGSDHIVVTVSTRTDLAKDGGATILDTTSFGWRILRALVDEVHPCADGPPDARHLTSSGWTGIRMIKRAWAAEQPRHSDIRGGV